MRLGAIWNVPFVIVRHSAFSSSISLHSALRSSPGRTKSIGASCIAHFVAKLPSCDSMSRRRRPTSRGSVSVA